MDIKEDGSLSFCQNYAVLPEENNKDWSDLNLHSSAIEFLKRLDLPRIHPHCTDDSLFRSFQDGVPLPIEEEYLGDEYYYEKDMGLLGRAITLWCQAAPALLAMSELWLRLFAFAIAPLAMSYLLSNSFEFLRLSFSRSSNSSLSFTTVKDKRREMRQLLVVLMGLSSCVVLLTDTMYVQANGRWYGGVSLVLMVALSFRATSAFRFYRRRTNVLIAIAVGVSLYLLSRSNPAHSPISKAYGTPSGIDLPTIQPGLYYDASNPFVQTIVQNWPQHTRIYDVEHGATPYLVTGDGLTGIPFIVNSVQPLSYHRVWVTSPEDYEAIALDIAFGNDGKVHDGTKPVFLILHGLNGGSQEEYVREFVVRKTREGHTCVVMIARGLMDTPLRGWNLFHGARITDIEVSAKALRHSLPPTQTLIGVGFSMGAIVLSNYVARSSTFCYLDAAVAVSGGLDMREQLGFTRSMRLWQPMLAQGLREVVVGKFDGRIRQRLTREEHLFTWRASSVSEIDTHAIVTYNGYDDIVHYYSEMSAMGDTTVFQKKSSTSLNTTTTTETDPNYTKSSNNSFGRIAQVAIPFCVIHALDDPLITWKTMGHDPEALVKTGSGSVVMLLTKKGGHVGWPLGMNPRSEGWKWMHEAVGGFADGVDIARKQ